MRFRMLVIAALTALLSPAAHAYVDPGLISAVYQLGYMAVAALAAMFIFRPWEFLKAKFRSLFGRDTPAQDAADAAATPQARQENDEQH